MSKAVLRSPVTRPFEEALRFEGLEEHERIRCLSKTERGLAQLKEEASTLGFQEGYSLGLEQGRRDGEIQGKAATQEAYRRELDEFRIGLQQIDVRFEKALSDWFADSELKLAELAVLVASRVLGEELRDEERFLGLVRTALAEVTHASRATVRVNPFDSPALRARADEVIGGATSVKFLDIVDDPSIEAGLVVESDGGVIDAQLSVQIARALAAIRGDS